MPLAVTFCVGAIEMGDYFRTIYNTLWLYPRSNIEAVLAATTVPYKRVGDVLTFRSVANIETVATEIYNSTVSGSFPDGYNVGVGSLLLETGRRITFCLEGGAVFMVWGEAELRTNQASLPIGGDAPVGTQGYLTTYLAGGNVVGAGYDPVRVVRI